MNDVPDYGIWELYNITEVANKPEIGSFGLLEYFGSSRFKVQKAYPRNLNDTPKIRFKSDTGSWSVWIEL